MKRRMKLWSPQAKAKWMYTLKHPPTSKKSQQEKQKIYAARHKAKAKGLPLPELPTA